MTLVDAVRVVALAALTASASTGCAHEELLPPPEPYEYVHFRMSVPDAARWHFVGKVDGVAPNVGWVDEVHLARLDIRLKALKLGARVVKIDRIRIPPDHLSARHRHVTIYVGRAYAEGAEHKRRPSR